MKLGSLGLKAGSLEPVPGPVHTPKFARTFGSVISEVLRSAPLIVMRTMSPFANKRAGRLSITSRVTTKASVILMLHLLKGNWN